MNATAATLRLRTAAPDGAPAAVMLAFLATAGLFYVNIMPALVDGLIHGLGFTTEQAGLVNSVNVYGAALGALAASFVVHRLAWKPVAVALLFGLILLDCLSMFVTTPQALIALRLMDGLDGGFLVGTGFAVIARTRDPDRVFGVLMIVQFGLGGVGLMALPQLVTRLGSPVLFGALVLFSVATLAMVPFLAPYPVTARPSGAERAAAPAATASRLGLPLTLFGIFLFQAANMGLAAYVIGLGEAAGLGRDFISPVLGIANWVGIFGSGLVVVISRRYGRFWPMAAGLVLTVLGIAAFLRSDLGAVYAAANALTSITWSLVIPYMFGLCAEFGRTGRSATVASFCSKLGLASGPLVAGYLVGGGHYDRLVWVAIAALVLSTSAALRPALASDRSGRVARA
jgi:predicted MFS family arabinose efflux permease